MLILKETKGTTMVEAAIIMPLVLLSVMAMIYLLLNIYSSVSLQAHMHLMLRQQSNKVTEMTKCSINDEYVRDRIRRKAEAADIVIERHKSLPNYVNADKSIKYTGNMIIKKTPKAYSYGKSYVIKESDIVRTGELIGNIK